MVLLMIRIKKNILKSTIVLTQLKCEVNVKNVIQDRCRFCNSKSKKKYINKQCKLRRKTTISVNNPLKMLCSKEHSQVGRRVNRNCAM